MDFELTTTPTDKDAKTISQGLIKSNHAMVKDLESEDAAINFSIFARNEQGKITGGLRATCFWNTLHIELLWTSEEERGQKIGSRLIHKAEQFALDKGFEKALLESTRWQAKPFYEKLGYQLIATVPDYPKGHACHFMTKKLI